MADSYYQQGYDKGYAEGAAGELSSSILPDWLDVLNTEQQQEYENGYDAGYEDGKAHWEETHGEEG
jgi:flagellar biosynthesis/type III secretory pathway protein FliH